MFRQTEIPPPDQLYLSVLGGQPAWCEQAESLFESDSPSVFQNAGAAAPSLEEMSAETHLWCRRESCDIFVFEVSAGATHRETIIDFNSALFIPRLPLTGYQAVGKKLFNFCKKLWFFSCWEQLNYQPKLLQRQNHLPLGLRLALEVHFPADFGGLEQWRFLFIINDFFLKANNK